MTLEERIAAAKLDPSEMEALIQDYEPFVRATISKTLKKYIQSDDENLTIGMMGFHEAVVHYDLAKGSFLSYAKIVIRNKLIDEVRREHNQTKNIELARYVDDDVSTVQRVYNDKALEVFENRKVQNQRKDDIVIYRETLKEWDMTMDDLLSVSPKKKSLLKLYQSIGKTLAEDEEIMTHMRQTRRLPAKFILERFKIDRKKLDRGRKYIIAVAELWAGDFESLQSFISGR
ncbi:sigma factor [Fusibacter sp. JL216-2]|uniref:sigma factor n=1 Tax=Fusibacter sp. JL216-2 TaxID=3071453 RepID=UPI003D34AD8A